jgi:hypothetical protein
VTLFVEPCVVEMRGEVQAEFIRDAVERQHSVVEINLVRMIIVPKLLGALEELVRCRDIELILPRTRLCENFFRFF